MKMFWIYPIDNKRLLNIVYNTDKLYLWNRSDNTWELNNIKINVRYVVPHIMSPQAIDFLKRQNFVDHAQKI